MQRYKRILLVVLPFVVLLIGGAAYATINLTSQKPAQYSALKPGINIDQGEKGLVGWWKLNGNAKDSTPYSNDGQINGSSVTPTTDRKGTPNGAYAFAGGTNRITLPDTRSDFSADEGQALTVSIWMKTGTPAANQELFWHQDGCVGWNMEIRSTGALYFTNTIGTNCSNITYYNANSPTTGPNYGDNTWHLVTGVINRPAGTISIYVDGVLIKSNSIPTTGPSLDLGRDFFIGNAYASLYPFIGSLSDARIYNRALSAGEIQNLYNSYNSQVNACTSSCTVNLSAGLVGYWPFNGNANDATPYQDNGTLSSPPPTLTADRFGRPNSAYSFDGTNNYIDFGSSSVLNPPQAISISSWIKPTANGFRTNYISREQSYRQIYFNDNKLYFQLGFQDGSWAANWISSTATIPLNVWTNVVTVFDGSSGSTRARIYINGVLDKQGSVSGNTLKIFSTDLTVGASPANDGYFQGSIDDIRIYNRPLSTAEVQALYNLPD